MSASRANRSGNGRNAFLFARRDIAAGVGRRRRLRADEARDDKASRPREGSSRVDIRRIRMANPWALNSGYAIIGVISNFKETANIRFGARFRATPAPNRGKWGT